MGKKTESPYPPRESGLDRQKEPGWRDSSDDWGRSRIAVLGGKGKFSKKNENSLERDGLRARDCELGDKSTPRPTLLAG